mmetsp:Transcript_4804/g.9164  ORF Transcript_4804/g.9164 Transcript_4804/m.9164 type:complete len:296 (-) Transcript_4804:100-987(-)|eukprot:CAMPEP_0176493318 /NCGR_PEP_ID=MMETSP0200_2-20121128/9487_1 /TAXON_ID=947934 /ORGANISM="Chaetoceros sp., Strain GSL56" /LENGTH=295 /DNA_ID=CAMNT_0017890977 /DNA_START=79 /DNA_END=966 /DNA_ORIENTATION=-
MTSLKKSSTGPAPYQPGQSVYRNSQSTQSSSNQVTNDVLLQEPHHVIRFRTSKIPEPPKHSTRNQARLAVKKRLESNNANNLNKSNVDNSRSASTSQLKPGSQDRGRDSTLKGSESGIVYKLRRSISTKRSQSKTRKIKIISSGGSVCSNSSMKSSKSLRSIRSAGSRVLTKVRSFRRSKSIDGRSVGSTGTRRGWFGRRRRKDNGNGSGENFLFVKQTSTSEDRPKRSNHSNRSLGFLGLGLLCGSFEPMCHSFLCGNGDHEEDLIGRVIGPDPETPPETPETSVEYDEDDPRY